MISTINDRNHLFKDTKITLRQKYSIGDQNWKQFFIFSKNLPKHIKRLKKKFYPSGHVWEDWNGILNMPSESRRRTIGWNNFWMRSCSIHISMHFQEIFFDIKFRYSEKAKEILENLTFFSNFLNFNSHNILTLSYHKSAIFHSIKLPFDAEVAEKILNGI